MLQADLPENAVCCALPDGSVTMEAALEGARRSFHRLYLPPHMATKGVPRKAPHQAYWSSVLSVGGSPCWLPIECPVDLMTTRVPMQSWCVGPHADSSTAADQPDTADEGAAAEREAEDADGSDSNSDDETVAALEAALTGLNKS